MSEMIDNSTPSPYPDVMGVPDHYVWEEDLLADGNCSLMYDTAPPPEHPLIKNVYPLYKSLPSEPAAWEAMTGTAGKADGCDRPFWLRQDAAEYVQRHGGYIRPLFTSPVGPDSKTIARAISESYGEIPDDLAPLSLICGHNNEPLPCWKVYEEQAKAILALFGTPSPQPRPGIDNCGLTTLPVP